MKKHFLYNMSWIFFGNILKSALSFILSIITARWLSVGDFGIINYCNSLIALFSSVATLGLNGVITKQFADDEQNSSAYISTGIILRVAAAVLSIFILQIFAHVTNSDPVVEVILFFQSLSILFTSFDLLKFWFRYKNSAKNVIIITFIGFGVSAFVKIASLLIWHSIVLYSIGISVEGLVIALLLFVQYKKTSNFKLIFSKTKAKKMLKLSYPFIFSAVMTTSYAQTDKLMLNSMISSESVAQYSVALTLAGVFSIIPTALMEGFQPEVMKNKNKNEEVYRTRIRQMYAITFWTSFLYCTVVMIFAKQIIMILYGAKYMEAVPALSLVVWYSAFSYFGGINHLYLVAENRTKWVQYGTLIGACTNVALNIILIPHLGIVGAALASLLTQLFVNFILLGIVPSLRDNLRLLLEGVFLQKIDLKYLFALLKSHK